MAEINYAHNLEMLSEQISKAAKDSGRKTTDIEVVAISKTQDVAAIKKVNKLGIKNFGENKAQELIDKAQNFKELNWHFVGQLQSNKIKKIASIATLIHSVDSKKQIDILSRLTDPPDILIQLSADGDPSRGGVTAEDFDSLLEFAHEKKIVVRGIMHVPPLNMDPAKCFETAKSLADTYRFSTLSMGMSGDFELAIAHGATMIRIGSNIFGPRVYK